MNIYPLFNGLSNEGRSTNYWIMQSLEVNNIDVDMPCCSNP